MNLNLPAILKQAEALPDEWRVLSPGCLFIGRQPLLLHYPRAYYSGTTKHDLPPMPTQSRKATAEFIAAARTLVPQLVEALEEAQGKLESIKIRLLAIVEEEGEVGVDSSYLFSMLDTIDPTILGPITPVILGESE